MSEQLWEYGHIVQSCSKMEEHNEDCPGAPNCKPIPAPKSTVDLHNETIEWNNRGMVITGIPRALANGPFPGIAVEIFELECRFAGLIKYLETEFEEFDVEKASDYYRQVMVDKLRSARKSYDEAVTDIAVAKTPLLGPNGEVLH